MSMRFAALVVVALGMGSVLSGCRPRQAPVEQDRMALGAAIGLPANRLIYQGELSDPYWHYVRVWKILAEGQDVQALGDLAKTAGHLRSLYGQVQQYNGGADLAQRLRAEGPYPLTEKGARDAALATSRRLWPRAAADWTTVSVKSRLKPLGDVRRPIPAYQVDLTFPNAPRDTAREAHITFVVADGTCISIYARLWDGAQW